MDLIFRPKKFSFLLVCFLGFTTEVLVGENHRLEFKVILKIRSLAMRLPVRKIGVRILVLKIYQGYADRNIILESR